MRHDHPGNPRRSWGSGKTAGRSSGDVLLYGHHSSAGWSGRSPHAGAWRYLGNTASGTASVANVLWAIYRLWIVLSRKAGVFTCRDLPAVPVGFVGGPAVGVPDLLACQVFMVQTRDWKLLFRARTKRTPARGLGMR